MRLKVKMSELQKKLIQRAIEQYNHIYPCSNRTDLSDCFTVYGGKTVFWFNTEDDSTHVLFEDVC